jgi:zinc protease
MALKVPFFFLMKVNRTIAPAIFPIDNVTITPIEELSIGNIQVYKNNAIKQEIVKCDLVFEAGSKYEVQHGTAAYTIRMLQEGTTNKTATQIAEAFSKLGYFIEYTSGVERAVISLSGLSKNINKALVLVLDIVLNAQFDTNEWAKQQALSIQSLQINQQKTAFLASNIFKNQLFGNTHPLGTIPNETLIKSVTTEHLKDFHKKHILSGISKVFISGNINEPTWNQFTKILANTSFEKQIIAIPENRSMEPNIAKKHEDIEGSVQCSLRIGQASIDRKHPHYFDLVLTNTILGGYFGSRLMKNIRENKGYTYGISSHLIPIPVNAYWLLSCDLIKDKKEEAIQEIYKEITLLQTELVSETELETARNYLIGDYANTFNAAFDLIEKKKTSLYEQLPADYYHTFIANVRKVTAQKIKEAAISYLSLDRMIEVAVG